MKKVNYKKLKSVEKTSHGLMTALWDELNMLREGETTVHRANAVIKLAQQICYLAEIDLEGVSVRPNKLRIG